jgi:hypothetical protein
MSMLLEAGPRVATILVARVGMSDSLDEKYEHF